MSTSGLTFRVPHQKIIATHFLSEGWAPDCWSYCNIHAVEHEMEYLKTLGFNTLILPVPWTGFQPTLAPITYYEEYFELFEQVMERAQARKLQVMLRIGYAHDNGPVSTPEGYLRAIVIAGDAGVRAAWEHYVARLWEISCKFKNLIGGFVTWEDFFLLDLMHVPLKQRLLYAQKTGYQAYLATRHNLDDVAAAYGESFTSFSDVPVPAYKAPGLRLFCEFWDDLLINTVFTITRKHFPMLSMEVRIDCEPTGSDGKYICHERTFDLTEGADVSMIYYAPAWGAPNDGRRESTQAILDRMQFLFDHLHAATQNHIFIDQFNFIDNTPGFEQNTRIDSSEMAEFLEKATSLLIRHTIGYGLWTLRDVPANLLRNGLFARNYAAWEIVRGTTHFDSDSNRYVVCLQTSGSLSQRVTADLGSAMAPNTPFQLDFQIRPLGPGTHRITVEIIRNSEVVYQHVPTLASTGWQKLHLTEIPFHTGDVLQVIWSGDNACYMSHFYLYSFCQENGILDRYGQPKPFFNHILTLNRRLQAASRITGFLNKSDLLEQPLFGLDADLWMGQLIYGEMDPPSAGVKILQFMVKIYVPETWKDYQNMLTLRIQNQPVAPVYPITAGYQEMSWTLDPSETAGPVKFELQADRVYNIETYHPDSWDKRKVSLQILGLGFE